MALHGAALTAAPDIAGLQLKWPNDLMVGEAKLGGILLERAESIIICGIGVNLGWTPDLPGRATVSLANLGQRVPVERFAELLAARFADALTRWRSQPLASLQADWLARAHPAGIPLFRTDSDGKRLTGTFDGLEEDGSLRLRGADGALHIVSSGEIMLG